MNLSASRCLLYNLSRREVASHRVPRFALSTPVRGSVDAGQPDSADTRSSIRNLVAAQEKQNARAGYHVNSAQGANALEKTADHRRSQKRPNINVTTNPLDISLIGATQPCNTQGCSIQSSGSTKSRGRSAGEFSSTIPSLVLNRKTKNASS